MDEDLHVIDECIIKNCIRTWGKYTEKWQDRCHPLGWLCELPHHP